MEFELYDEAQYRALGADGLEARRAAIAAELEGGSTPTDKMREQVALYNAEVERRSAAAALREQGAAAALASNAVIGAQLRSQAVKPAAEDAAAAEEAEFDPYDTVEYRKAFMDYVVRGKEMPSVIQHRSGDDKGTIITTPTVTTGVAPQVPTSTAKEIISKMEYYGDIWNAVRKMSVQGGVVFRIVDLNPTATWLQKGDSKTELSVSGYQGVTNDATISFSFYELECRMSQSLLAEATTYADFQALFVPAVSKAMVKALEQAIVHGDGVGQFLGIAKDPRIENVVTMTKAEMKDWKPWHSKVDAAIDPEYDNGEWWIAKKTWNKYVDTMANTEGSQVGYTYDPVSGKRTPTLMGKTVHLVSTAILPDADAVTTKTGDVVAIYGDLYDYAVNTQPGMPMTTVSWVDHETNQKKTKALMASDGKVLDPYGFLLVKLGA